MDASQLLGGAQRVRTRVRGFAPWAPRGATAELLDQVRGVLEEYEDYLPLTIRQIFYRLVGAHDYEKTERAYARLSEHLNRARRARVIPMDVIRDDGGVISEPNSWASAEQFMRTVRAMAADFKLDRSTGQKARLVVTCEAAGMVPQLERVTHPLGVTVMSGGGFESTTDRHKFAAALAGYGRENEWNGACPFQQSRRVGSAVRNDEVWLQGHQFARVSLARLPIAGACPANLDLDVVSPPELGEFLAERVHARLPFPVSFGIRHQHADPPHALAPLRARRERPRGRRAAEQRYERAALHSITSSAATSSLSGTVRPSIRAV